MSVRAGVFFVRLADAEVLAAVLEDRLDRPAARVPLDQLRRAAVRSVDGRARS